MAKTPQSRKAKGRKLQQAIRDALLSKAPFLTENDVRSTSMGASGTDILLSESALKVYPFAIECKAQESIQIWKALEQSESNANEKQRALLCFKRNRSETYVALKLSDFLDLLQIPNKFDIEPLSEEERKIVDEIMKVKSGSA